MSLGELKVYGKAAKGLLNDRFASYVRWLIEAAGTPLMKRALTDKSIHVQFWIHGKKVRFRGRFPGGRKGYTTMGLIWNRTGKWKMDQIRADFSRKAGQPWAPKNLLQQTMVYDTKRQSPTRFVIQLAPEALCNPMELAQTILHEMKHLTDALEGKVLDLTQAAEGRARTAQLRVLRSLTDREIWQGYEEHFGTVLAGRCHLGVRARPPYEHPRPQTAAQRRAEQQRTDPFREPDEDTEFGYSWTP